MISAVLSLLTWWVVPIFEEALYWPERMDVFSRFVIGLSGWRDGLGSLLASEAFVAAVVVLAERFPWRRAKIYRLALCAELFLLPATAIWVLFVGLFEMSRA